MGMVDQVMKTVEVAPLGGKLSEIDAILARVINPKDELSEEAALRAIAAIVAPESQSGEIYQKPWG